MAFRSFVLFPVLVSAVLAQSQNPFIPSSISSQCASFLTALNSDSAFNACTQPFITALQPFLPGASPSSSDATNALNSLCADSAMSGCPQSTITTQLSAFYGACIDELTSSRNQMVATTYDSLYSMWPLRAAICSKDDAGKYCALEISNSSGAGSIAAVDSAASQKQALVDQYLYSTPQTNGAAARRDLSNTSTALLPNTTTYLTTNLVFMFLQPSMSSTRLCTSCTRNILTPYIAFESSSPYGPGMSSSLLLAGQVPLYNAVTSKCGQSFLGGAVQAAGGLSGGIVHNGASHAGSQGISTAVGAILGVAALMAASL